MLGEPGSALPVTCPSMRWRQFVPGLWDYQYLVCIIELGIAVDDEVAETWCGKFQGAVVPNVSIYANI